MSESSVPSVLPERLECGVCLLRAWRRDDKPALVFHINNRRVWRNLRDIVPHPYTHAEGVLVRSVVKDGTLADRVMYGCTRDPGLPYVSASLSPAV